MELILGFISGLIIWVIWQIRKRSSPQHFISLPTTSFLSTLRTFLTKPALEAIELAYWPLLFQYDAIVTWFLGNWWVVIGNPDLIKAILLEPGLTEKQLFTDLSPHALIGEYMGTNVLYSKGEEWRKHRSVINPAFHRNFSKSTILNCVEELVDHINSKFDKGCTTQNIHTLLTGMTLDALGKAILGFNFGATRNPQGKFTQAYHRAAQGASKNIYFLFPFLEYLPIPSRTKDRLAVRKFRQLTSSILEGKRSDKNHSSSLQTDKVKKGVSDSNREDLLTLMIKASQSGDQPLLTDKELINNTVVLFAAGHDTTANSISYALYHLTKNPIIQERAFQEIYQLVGDTTDPATKLASLSDNQLIFMDAIILESMRLLPTLPQLRRELIKDYQLPDGTLLPRGTLIMLQTYTAMNHPDYWSSPHQFNPDRFLTTPTPSSPTRELHPTTFSQFFGFGGGTRACIGSSMARLEMRLTLALLLYRFKISLPDASPHRNRLITNQDPVCRPIDLALILTPRQR